jgi:hypothetical protein
LEQQTDVPSSSEEEDRRQQNSDDSGATGQESRIEALQDRAWQKAGGVMQAWESADRRAAEAVRTQTPHR